MNTPSVSVDAHGPWWRGLTRYHWFVFIVASAAWFFDCLDQRLFSLARIPALNSLMVDAKPGEIQAAGKEVTAIFLIGWGIGGMIFGALGDRFGRAKMLTVTVLLYSVAHKGFFPFLDTGIILGVSVASHVISFPALAERLQYLVKVFIRYPAVASF